MVYTVWDVSRYQAVDYLKKKLKEWSVKLRLRLI